MTTFENDGVVAHAAIAEEAATRRVWDWPVRVFHWCLVVAFAGAFITNRLGVSYFKYHVLFGYAVIVLVAFRVIWGFVGTRHARFVNFIRGPKHALDHLSRLRKGLPTHHAGHNPLGAFMVIALLFALGAQASFGLFADDEIFNVGPLRAMVSKQGSLALTSLHRHLFYWIAAAAALHVVAVAAHVVFKREPLVRAMITGSKPAFAVRASEEIRSSRGWLAIIVLLVVTAALLAGIHYAPFPESDLAAF